MPMPAPSELAEHSTSVGHNFRHCKPKPSEHPVPGGAPHRVVGISDNQPVSEPAGQSKTSDDLVPKPAPSQITEQPGGEGLLLKVRCWLDCRESSRSHNSQKTHHRWVDRTSRDPGRSRARLL